MVNIPIKIDHIGIAVSNIEQALSFYVNKLGFPLVKIETIEREHVNVAFLAIDDVYLELIEPTNKDSTIYKFIKRNGEGLHHIALAVDHLIDTVKHYEKKGIQFIHHHPAKGANNRAVTFIKPQIAHGVLYELCSTWDGYDK